MSNEKKNMNDINYQQTTGQTEQGASEQTAEQQAFSEEIRRRLAQPDSGKPTLEEFKLLVYKDREKRRKKRNTLVACLIAAFVVGYLSLDALVPEVGADKNPKETIMTEDGVIIEDGGYGSSSVNENTITTEDWERILEEQRRFDKLLVPTYIPEGYYFESLTIENIVEKDILYKFIFKNQNDNKIQIEQFIINSGELTLDINDITTKTSCCKGIVYFQSGTKIATIQIDDGIIINVLADLKENEVIRIIENLQ